MRVVYLMHVDIRWPKQRPHFLAEELNAENNVTVLFRAHPRRWRLPASRLGFRAGPLPPLPNRQRLGALSLTVVAKAVATATRADLMWVTHPSLAPAVRSFSGTVVYDCMDDALAMSQPETAAHLAEAESGLVNRADLVLASSDELARRLRLRYGCDPSVVRNAISDEMLKNARTQGPLRTRRSPGSPAIGYVGTIGPWIDWDAIILLASARPAALIHLTGPCSAEVPSLPANVLIHDPIAHSAVLRYLRSMDVLFMPFVRDEVTLAVDPVKIYEYIAAGRPIVAAHYPELAYFGDRLVTYKLAQELPSILDTFNSATEAVPVPDWEQFLLQNTWSERALLAQRLLSRLSEQP